MRRLAAASTWLVGVGLTAVASVVQAATVTGSGGRAGVGASRRSGWLRCAGFAASGATAFGLVSALVRLSSRRA